MARRSRTAPPRVRMVHDGVPGHYDAPSSAVEFWRQRGWRPEGEKETAPKAAVKTEKKEA